MGHHIVGDIFWKPGKESPSISKGIEEIIKYDKI